MVASLRPPSEILRFQFRDARLQALAILSRHFRAFATAPTADRSRPRPGAPVTRRSKGTAISLRASCASRHLSSAPTICFEIVSWKVTKGLSEATGLRCSRTCLRCGFHRFHQRIFVAEGFVLNAQWMPVAHHVSHLRRHHGLYPGLHELSISGQIHFGHPRCRREPAFVLRRIAAHGANVIECSLLAAHHPLPDDQVGICRISASRLERRLIESGRQHVDQIDIAGEFAVFFLGHASRHEDSEMTRRFRGRCKRSSDRGP